MVVVDGWTHSPLMSRLSGIMDFMRRLRAWLKGKNRSEGGEVSAEQAEPAPPAQAEAATPPGTFVEKFTADGLIERLSGEMDFDILIWRSVSVPFLRSVIYPDWGGRTWLKLLFWLEERFPRLLGRIGQYPLIVISKPARADEVTETPSEV